MTANVVGPVCESGDTFATGREMGRVGADDLVVFRTAGAYAATMASTYNSRPLTAEVIVRGERMGGGARAAGPRGADPGGQAAALAGGRTT